MIQLCTCTGCLTLLFIFAQRVREVPSTALRQFQPTQICEQAVSWLPRVICAFTTALLQAIRMCPCRGTGKCKYNTPVYLSATCERNALSGQTKKPSQHSRLRALHKMTSSREPQQRTGRGLCTKRCRCGKHNSATATSCAHYGRAASMASMSPFDMTGK